MNNAFYVGVFVIGLIIVIMLRRNRKRPSLMKEAFDKGTLNTDHVDRPIATVAGEHARDVTPTRWSRFTAAISGPLSFIWKRPLMTAVVIITALAVGLYLYLGKPRLWLQIDTKEAQQAGVTQPPGALQQQVVAIPTPTDKCPGTLLQETIGAEEKTINPHLCQLRIEVESAGCALLYNTAGRYIGKSCPGDNEVVNGLGYKARSEHGEVLQVLLTHCPMGSPGTNIGQCN